MAIPSNCHFSIRPVNRDKSLFVIREEDTFKEYPNIYAKIVSSPSHERESSDTPTAALIILCDTGCGTSLEAGKLDSHANTHTRWNVGSILEATINPQNRLPYLVITSHCHYDHILGIKHLDLTKSVVLASAYDKSFITPRSHLAKHSLCEELGISPPKYNVGFWAKDFQEVTVLPPSSSQPIRTGIVILQTPGHTPDSLAWYDSTLSPPHIFVGDTLYERQSPDTKDAKWGREPPMPTIFNADSNLDDWYMSMEKMLRFVQERNRELEITAAETEGEDWVLVSQAGRGAPAPRVMLGAAHVTIAVDAKDCLFAMGVFMTRILWDTVPHRRVKGEGENEIWLWDDTLDADPLKHRYQRQQADFGRFSVQAPLFVVEKKRAQMAKAQQAYRQNGGHECFDL